LAGLLLAGAAGSLTRTRSVHAAQQ
jgi:hypothetical protein